MDIEALIETYIQDTAWRWISQVFVVVFLALLADFIQRRLFGRLYLRLKQTRTPWDDALVDALRRPLSALIWILGLTFAAQIVRNVSQLELFALLEPLRDVGVIACLAWFLVRFIARAEDNLLASQRDAEHPMDRTTMDAIARLLRLSVIITSALVALQTLGFSISGVLAFGGIGGIAVGFAAKDLLANFFGGLMIYLDRPFAVGDWIRSPDRDIEGTVEQIGWRLTCIRTFDKRPLYVPNATFASITVENPSRMSHRRIYETIGLRYEDADKVAAITGDVEQMLKDHPEIDDSQTLMVHFNKYGASSLDFFVYTFTHTINWTAFHAIKQDVLLRIYAIIRQHGADIAFPTSTVHVSEPVALVDARAGSGQGGQA